MRLSQALLCGTLLLGCGRAPEPSPAAAPAPAPVPPAEAAPLVVFLGDSITAGLGLPADQAWPAVVGAELARRGLPVRVVNAGLSGDTSAGGLRRLDWLLEQKPDALVVALGANDMLRGQPPAETRANLAAIVAAAQAAGVRVLLVGMRANPSLGAEYVAAFDGLYPSLAAESAVPLVPFLLEGVAGVPTLNQPDGIHPTAEGQAQVAAVALVQLEPLIRSLAP